MDSIKIAGGGVVSVCENCSTAFVSYQPASRPAPKRCPACNDRKQFRPSVALERREITRFEGVRVHSLPGEWVAYDTKDRTRYKIDVRGAEFGRAWDGRIVIYAEHSFRSGDIVTLREMSVTHEVRAHYTERTTSAFTQLKGGPSSVTKRVTLPIQATELTAASNRIFGDDVKRGLAESVVETEERAYVVLERAADGTRRPEGRQLVWLTATEKTTLKGLGAQYASSIHGEPVWSKSIGGGVRNRRRWTTAMLAITDHDHPVTVAQDYYVTGSGQVVAPEERESQRVFTLPEDTYDD